MSLNRLAEGLTKAAKEVHAFHMTEEDIEAAMKHKPIPEHCPHYCEIKQIQRNGETFCSCDTCGEWKDDKG